MNLANLTFQSIRFLLLPFALLYGGAVWLRNRMYDKEILKSTTVNLPIICVGNLSVGGTGKSPMVEYLLRLLTPSFQPATLSRGYKRKTKGYALANDHSSALEIGDEPMQFHLKFPAVAVAVGEERIEAIPQLLHDRPDTDVIILDDGFQHRAIKAGLNILLTDYNNLFTRDFFLPTGDLRDERNSYKRAEVIIVTKCIPDLSDKERSEIIAEIKPLPHQQIYFSTIAYGTPYHILNPQQEFKLHKNLEILLVTGIANIDPLKQHIHDNSYTYEKITFGDHHIFSIDDLKEINKRFSKLDHEEKIIITTEKDAVRLVKFKEDLENSPLFVLPIRHRILFNEEEQLKETIISFISKFSQNNKHG
ncbi:MAG: tetraacyldisaccharide 4'-kinase [Chitinophagaceae bacterium]|nr:tetraacyldisaccharide 4'-kinase [Chitinophagaceae bacterium]